MFFNLHLGFFSFADLTNKTLSVLATVSNCYRQRMETINALKKEGVSVQIYGACGMCIFISLNFNHAVRNLNHFFHRPLNLWIFKITFL